MPRVAACPDVRQAVLEAAKLLIERYGYKKMTIDDIASEVGIGKATLYGYFESKQDVGLAVIDHYHDVIQNGWEEIARENAPAPEKLSRMIFQRVMFLFDVAHRHRQSMDDCLAALRPLVLIRRDHYNDVESAILANVLREGVASGQFECADPVTEARTILTCTGGLMPLNLSPKELASREQMIEKTSQVTQLVLRALKVDRLAFSGQTPLRG